MQTPANTESLRSDYRKQLYGLLYPPPGYLLTRSDIEAIKRLRALLGVEVRLSRIDFNTNQEVDIETGEVIREF